MVQINMEMPKNCRRCAFHTRGELEFDYFCFITRKKIAAGISGLGRDVKCPLREVSK